MTTTLGIKKPPLSTPLCVNLFLPVDIQMIQISSLWNHCFFNTRNLVCVNDEWNRDRWKTRSKQTTKLCHLPLTLVPLEQLNPSAKRRRHCAFFTPWCYQQRLPKPPNVSPGRLSRSKELHLGANWVKQRQNLKPNNSPAKQQLQNKPPNLKVWVEDTTQITVIAFIHTYTRLVGGWTNPFENTLVQLDHFP